MTRNTRGGFVMSEHAPLIWAINNCNRRDLAIEVGTYYGGWTGVLSAAYNNVITLQCMSDTKLMHFHNTQYDDAGNKHEFGAYMEKSLPSQYHGRYDFNYMVDNIHNMQNVTAILSESPPKIDWHWKFDLCTVDISRRPEENLKQYEYWKQHARTGAIMLMGVYKLKPHDNESLTLEQFMSTIDSHCDFVPGCLDYIYIKF